MVRPATTSFLLQSSSGIGLPEGNNQLASRMSFGPLNDFVKTILPVSIVVCTRGLVEVQVELTAKVQFPIVHHPIHPFKTLNFNMLLMGLHGEPCKVDVEGSLGLDPSCYSTPHASS